MLKEFGPEIKYIKGFDNDTSGAQSRLMFINSDITESDIASEQLVKSYGVEQLDGDTFPLIHRTINKYQRKDKELVEKSKCANYHPKTFREGINIFLFIYKNDKIVVPTIFQRYAVNWYHTYLLHPGMNRTEATIIQHYYWPHLRDDIHTHIKFCKTCHKQKKQKFKYGKLPAKESDAIPWDRLLVYLIDLYKIKREGHDEPIILKSLTMIDSETWWFEIVQYNDKQAATIANIVKQTWLCRYPHPTIITHNQVNELLGHAFKNDLIGKKYGIKAKCETTEKPQVNSIL